MAEADLTTISINSNLTRWVIDLVALRILLLGTQTTPRGGLMMAEVDLTTISINSNLVKWAINLVELRILVLGTQTIPSPRGGLMMAEVDLATISIRHNLIRQVVDPVALRIPTLQTQTTLRGASVRVEIHLLTIREAILHNRLIRPAILITATTMLGAAATTIIRVVHILIAGLLLAALVPLTLIKQQATQATEVEVILERV